MFFLFSLLTGICFTRIAIVQYSGVDQAALNSHSISLEVSETRGMIYDCNLKPLVNCEKTSCMAIKPSFKALESVDTLIPKSEKKNVLNELSKGNIAVFNYDKPFSNTEAIGFSKTVRYAENGICVHTVGYVNSDGKGIIGIEKYYDELLNNESGALKVVCEVDARLNALEGEKMRLQSENYNSHAGVALTVDKDIQLICEQALEKYNIGKGAAVVLDVESSEIRAIASYPEFSQLDPSSSLKSDAAPFINRAITPYAVGSVFKTVVAAAALEDGIKPDESYFCKGNIKIESRQFNCHKKTGHGKVDMYSATAQSCNPYFINLALLTGKEKICEMAQNLGLGKEIELCDGWYSAAGVIPSSQSLVSPQDLANFAFGQGNFLASPLQMAAVYAAIANKGVYRAPSLMRAVVNRNKYEIMRAELPANRRVMSEKTAELIAKMLFETVETGSGKGAKPDIVSAAGKTATAQSGEFDSTGKELLRAWFCGYFPYEAPRYAVAIVKEDGSGGAVDCAPIFKYIAEKIYEIK